MHKQIPSKLAYSFGSVITHSFKQIFGQDTRPQILHLSKKWDGPLKAPKVWDNMSTHFVVYSSNMRLYMGTFDKVNIMQKMYTYKATTPFIKSDFGTILSMNCAQVDLD